MITVHHIEIITELSVLTVIPFVSEMTNPDSVEYRDTEREIAAALNTARYITTTMLFVGNPSVGFVRLVFEIPARPG